MPRITLRVLLLTVAFTAVALSLFAVKLPWTLYFQRDHRDLAYIEAGDRVNVVAEHLLEPALHYKTLVRDLEIIEAAPTDGSTRVTLKMSAIGRLRLYLVPESQLSTRQVAKSTR